MKNEDLFARHALSTYQLYVMLAERETSAEHKRTLLLLAETAREQFDFWARKSGVRGDMVRAPMWNAIFLRTMRHVMGPRYTLRYLLSDFEKSIDLYIRHCEECTSPDDRRVVEAFIERMRALVVDVTE